MRGVVLTAFGSIDHLQDAELPMPTCRRDQIRIAVKAVSFNPVDYRLRESARPATKLPAILGFDVAGVVVGVGPAVTDFVPGDEVIAYLGGPSMAGGYAEYAVVPQAMAARKPRNIDFMAAAAIPLAGLTALQSLRRTGITPQQSLLISGGAGGVGSWTALIARALGVNRISATAGRVESRLYLTDEVGLSAARLIDYRGLPRTDLAARAIRANDDAPYDVCIDCIGGAMTHLSCDAVQFGGHVVSIVNGADASDEDPLFNKSAAFHNELIYAVAEYADPARHAIYGQQLAELSALIESGALHLPRITDLGALSAATVGEAHRQLATGGTIGKLVVSVG